MDMSNRLEEGKHSHLRCRSMSQSVRAYSLSKLEMKWKPRFSSAYVLFFFASVSIVIVCLASLQLLQTSTHISSHQKGFRDWKLPRIFGIIFRQTAELNGTQEVIMLNPSENGVDSQSAKDKTDFSPIPEQRQKSIDEQREGQHALPQNVNKDSQFKRIRKAKTDKDGDENHAEVHEGSHDGINDKENQLPIDEANEGKETLLRSTSNRKDLQVFQQIKVDHARNESSMGNVSRDNLDGEEDHLPIANGSEQKEKYLLSNVFIPANYTVAMNKTAKAAWKEGKKAWAELEAMSNLTKNNNLECPKFIIMEAEEVKTSHGYMDFPCGLTTGSTVTLIGVPQSPHLKRNTAIRRSDAVSDPIEVSHFMFELRGPKPSESKILHVNPRLRGDWTDKPVIEINSFFEGSWGRNQRCDGVSPAEDDERRVEGFPYCERWLQDDGSEERPTSWVQRMIEINENSETKSRFPFVQNRSFVMTVRAGLEGYHINVDGKHISSFRYQSVVSIETVAAAYVGGDVDVHSLIATSLPSVPPRSLTEQIFEDGHQWKAPKVLNQPLRLFIGVVSTTNHFVERMAIRASWFQDQNIQTGEVVARFFVALHPDREVNEEMKKEAEYYGDMVIVPFMDQYYLLMLKTLAIFEYGIQNVTTDFIMKCDDDTFVRVDAVLDEIAKVEQPADNLYLGKMNVFHKPLREGKWAVTPEEWPDEDLPPYANGVGFVLSRKIASHILEQYKKGMVELFKIEDINVGLWIKQYQEMKEMVHFVNVPNFYQERCEDGYIIAHYQTPAHMICLHKKLLKGDTTCCH